ncbi:MAG: RNA polymerase sigma factor [Aquihabitans sp.]
MTDHTALPEFPAFYDARLERTVRQVSLMVGSAAVAEDIAHDAMVQIYERWDQLEDPGAYLYRCAANGALQWLRHRDRRHPLDEETGTPRLTVVPAIEFVEMADALARLSDRQRVAVVLRYYEDLTEVEIAAALDCRVGSVGPLLTRARAVLRKELGA